jgi:hypothetical protein
VTSGDCDVTALGAALECNQIVPSAFPSALTWIAGAAVWQKFVLRTGSMPHTGGQAHPLLETISESFWQLHYLIVQENRRGHIQEFVPGKFNFTPSRGSAQTFVCGRKPLCESPTRYPFWSATIDPACGTLHFHHPRRCAQGLRLAERSSNSPFSHLTTTTLYLPYVGWIDWLSRNQVVQRVRPIPPACAIKASADTSEIVPT